MLYEKEKTSVDNRHPSLAVTPPTYRCVFSVLPEAENGIFRNRLFYIFLCF